MRRHPHTPHRVLAALTTALLLASCAPPPASMDQIRERGEIRVVTLNAPTSYYLGAHATEGLEFQLARAFAEELGVGLTMYPVADARTMQEELAAGRADIAAAQITANPAWKRVGEAAGPYEHIPQLVVYQRGHKRPRSTLQLESARLAVRAGSPQERILEKLKKTVAPSLEWTATAPRTADPLEDVDSGHADYAVVDAREFSFARHLYPKVRVGFALPQERPVQWIVRRGESALLERVNQYFSSMGQSGRLAQLLEQASGDARRFEYEESRKFREHMTARLPQYRSWFEQASVETGIDWRLLAAMGYQESKWNPAAESPNGAIGMMMLMASTAEALGVQDRANPEQSIFAGARYFAEVRAKIPERIPEPDRTWLTVAAYNVGFGHLEDARIITQMRGKNPDSWADVSEHLPLLAQERWYSRVRRGYARGWEPVQFVERVQRYLTLLEWQPVELAAGAVTRIEAPEPQERPVVGAATG